MRYKAIPAYYDAEYDGNEMLQRDVPFFLGHVGRARKKILELAVGTARAAIPMAQAGHRVVGVDNDEDMLALARHKCESVGLKERELRLVQSDILMLDLAEKFDWVVLLFNTFLNFTTLDQQDQLLKVVRKHLKPRGQFWLDIFLPNLEILCRDQWEHLDPATFYVQALDRTVHRDTELVRDKSARQIQHVTFHYLWFDDHGAERREKVQFDLTWLFPRELQLLLERNGMEIVEIYGDYDGSTVSVDSPRIIARAKASGH